MKINKLLFGQDFGKKGVSVGFTLTKIIGLTFFLTLLLGEGFLFAKNLTTNTLTDNTGVQHFVDAGQKAIFSLDWTDDEALDINGKKIYVRGNLFFTAKPNEVFTVNIGNATSDSYVSIQPLAKRVVKAGTTVAPTESTPGQTNDDIELTEELAQLVFCPEAGGMVEVNLFKDLLLTGSNYSTDGVVSLVGGKPGSTTGERITFSPLDMATDITITFTGQGQTVFKIGDGKKLVFESQAYSSTLGAHTVASLPSGKSAGARVLVAMDDTKENVVTNGKNKVVFQRLSYSGTTLDSRVKIGSNSFFTFVSNSITGIAGTSYAAVAFDCSGANHGRLELQVTGNNVASSYQDGAFIVGGNFLGTVDNGTSTPTITPGSYSNAYDFVGDKPSSVVGVSTTGIDFSQPAGDQAIVRVIDNLGYSESTDYVDSIASSNPNPGITSTGASTRRGLLVSNKCLSMSPMASNPYLETGWFDLNAPEVDVVTVGLTTTRTVYNKVYPYRYGFVLAVNGAIDVAHNTFLEYVSLGYNMNVNPSNISANIVGLLQTKLAKKITDANLVPDQVFKKHNPSAMIVDGLYVIVDDNTGNNVIHFEGASSYNTVYRHATITLFGNASLSFRGDVLGTKIDGTGYDEAKAYDGITVPYPDQFNVNNVRTSYGESAGEGVHVLDIEGLFEIRSQDDVAVTGEVANPFGWHARSGYQTRLAGDLTKPLQGGIIRLPTIVRSADDRELQRITDTALSLRPLTVGTLYHRYDKSAILANASFDFKNVRFINDDISRNVTYNPSVAQPIILGGEKAHFLSLVEKEANPDMPFWRVYGSEIHCSESMCVSGLRLLVRELPAYQKYNSTESVSNTSSIIFYNHGHSIDANLRGYGRLFLLGSKNNLSSASTSSKFLENAYVNVFRHTGRLHGASGSFLNNTVDLKLKTQFENSSIVPVDQKSMHMMILGNNSYLDVGWTSTEGIIKNTDNETAYTVYPFDHMSLGEVRENQTFTIKTDSQDYNPTTKLYTANPGELPASLTIDGDFIFLGAKTAEGLGSPKVVNEYNLGRVIYVNHGGKISITQDTTVNPPRPYVGFSEATIAIRVWKDVNNERGLNPIISLPGDQMKLSNPVSPYDLNLNLLTNVDSPYLNFKTLAGKGFGTEVRVAWDKVRNVATVPFMSPHFFDNIGLEMDFAGDSRAIAIKTNPVAMPTSGLIRMSTGDYLDQLSVSGATPSNPFRLYLSGDDAGISQVREIVSVKSDNLVPGEGPFAKLYIDQGARLGLGTRNWNLDSAGAWTKLGLSQVTLYANGNAQVDVNSNLIIADPQPLVPTTNFGSDIADTSPTAAVGAKIAQTHQISFYSVDTNEIRVPAGKSLDLSAFGKADVTTTGAVATQQIAISGKLRLIFEPGSELRFPDLGDSQAPGNTVDKMPILYLNEESELIFETANDILGKTPFATLADTARAKVKILGCGQIWLNKTAKMKIHDSSIVSVEADAQTPNTNILLSIQREGEMTVGDLNNAGGSFQVGNPVDVPGTKIDFTLRLNGEKARFEIGRNGFFGVGVGTVQSTSTRINRWTISPLQNVRSFRLRNIKGVFSHNRIYDGASAESSLMAIGNTEGYIVEQGPANAYFMGGGNVIYLRPDVTPNPFPVSVLSTAVDLADSTADSGKYSIMTTTQTLRSLTSKPASGFSTNTIIETINSSNSAYLSALKITAGDVSLLTGGLRFVGTMADTYRYLTAGGVNEIRGQTLDCYVALGHTLAEDRIGYVNNSSESIFRFGGNIVRSTAIVMKQGDNYNDSLPYGALKVASFDGAIGTRGNPVNYTTVRN